MRYTVQGLPGAIHLADQKRQKILEEKGPRRIHPSRQDRAGTFGRGERYFLRILLNHVTGAKSFEDLRTFDGVT